MITIVLVDDHKIVRQGLKELLEAESDFKVIGEAGDGLEGIEVAERLKPDIILSDLMMSKMDGIQLTREMRKRCQSTKTIILSVSNNSGYVRKALREGAKGYVLKESGIDELVTAIRQVVAGAIYLCPGLRKDGTGRRFKFYELGTE